LSRFRYQIRFPVQFYVGALLIVISIFFLTHGLLQIEISTIEKKDIQLRDNQIEEETEINFRDTETFKQWIEEAEIYSTDDNTLEVGNQKYFRVYVNSKILPEELVVHVFHEDLLEFFTTEEDESGFRQITKKLGYVPALRYGSIFSITFNMSNYEDCSQEQISSGNCNYGLNAKGSGEFKSPGKYFVQFSSKIRNGSFDHRQSPESLTEISDPRQIRLEKSINDLRVTTEIQNAMARNAQGTAYLGIGIGMLIAGITLISPTIIRTKGLTEDLRWPEKQKK